MPGLTATASQTIGPFFRVGLWQPEWRDLTRHGANGAPIRIEGCVLDGDGAPIHDALIEIWQADSKGVYAHPDDPRTTIGDRLFRGFGRCGTDSDGRYGFLTILPGAVPGPGGARQAPHVNVSVFARGLLARLITRMYFADLAVENAQDPVFRSIADESARRTLVAARAPHASGIPLYRFDIVLQGNGETAFFAV